MNGLEAIWQELKQVPSKWCFSCCSLSSRQEEVLGHTHLSKCTGELRWWVEASQTFMALLNTDTKVIIIPSSVGGRAKGFTWWGVGRVLTGKRNLTGTCGWGTLYQVSVLLLDPVWAEFFSVSPCTQIDYTVRASTRSKVLGNRQTFEVLQS